MAKRKSKSSQLSITLSDGRRVSDMSLTYLNRKSNFMINLILLTQTRQFYSQYTFTCFFSLSLKESTPDDETKATDDLDLRQKF